MNYSYNYIITQTITYSILNFNTVSRMNLARTLSQKEYTVTKKYKYIYIQNEKRFYDYL